MMDSQSLVREVSGLDAKLLERWIENGLLQPAVGKDGPVFKEIDMARARLIMELRDDFGIDDDNTVAIVLSLLDQIYGLRRELRCLVHAVSSQPVTVKQEILTIVETVREKKGP